MSEYNGVNVGYSDGGTPPGGVDGLKIEFKPTTETHEEECKRLGIPVNWKMKGKLHKKSKLNRFIQKGKLNDKNK